MDGSAHKTVIALTNSTLFGYASCHHKTVKVSVLSHNNAKKK
jgi:hypothetical protein